MPLKEKQTNNFMPANNFGGMLFAPGLFAGIKSGSSLFVFINIFIFALCLTLVCTSKKQMSSYCFIFFLSVGLTKFYLVTGIFYAYLGHPIAIIIYIVIYCVITFVLLGFGITHFVDWIKLKRDQSKKSLRIKLPAYFDNDLLTEDPYGIKQFEVIEKQGRERKIFSNFFYLGVALTIIVSLWQSDYLFFAENYFLGYKHSQIVSVFSRYVFFTLGYVLPLLVFLIAMQFLVNTQRYQKWVLKHLSLYKILLSAIYTSMGGILIIALLSIMF